MSLSNGRAAKGLTHVPVPRAWRVSQLHVPKYGDNLHVDAVLLSLVRQHCGAIYLRFREAVHHSCAPPFRSFLPDRSSSSIGDGSDVIPSLDYYSVVDSHTSSVKSTSMQAAKTLLFISGLILNSSVSVTKAWSATKVSTVLQAHGG